VILVDSSVWIDHLRNRITEQVMLLRTLVEGDEVLVGDLILCEVLQGAHSEREARRIETALQQFRIATLSGPDLAASAARNYRRLRRHGFTVRTTVDLIIGTFCIERGHALLHSDRDFEPMERFLGLRTA